MKTIVKISGILAIATVIAVLIYRNKEQEEEEYIPPGGIPAFYINLDKDVKNKKQAENTLKPIFPNLKRSAGILHSVGREGCRLAHIKANESGVASTKPGEYYIIFEDDSRVNPNANMTKSQILAAVKRSSETGADMIMLNIQNFPYDVEMIDGPKNINKGKTPEFYRLLGGVGSGLAYMVKHEFGKKLIANWKLPQNHMKHIDMTWHDLWPSNLVLVHKPLLFLGRAGPSTTGDVTWRNESDPEIDDFQWNLVPDVPSLKKI
tara:strand:+ start:3082 stop:3870 length:789 start_codon:yes stop_codon:yes gene_type:complete